MDRGPAGSGIRSLGGGCLIGLGAHPVDLALWMFDFPEGRDRIVCAAEAFSARPELNRMQQVSGCACRQSEQNATTHFGTSSHSYLYSSAYQQVGDIYERYHDYVCDLACACPAGAGRGAVDHHARPLVSARPRDPLD
jgi:predicted dehydrogenase